MRGKSGNPGGRPRVIAELRNLARHYAPAAIEELARLALKAKSETVRVSAIRELFDRGFGKPTQFVAADNEAIPSDMSAAELKTEVLASFATLFPEFRIVPVEQSTLIAEQRKDGIPRLRGNGGAQR